MTDAPIRNLGREKPREKVELSELESLGTGRVIACDCLVTGAGTWQFRDGAYVNDRFVSIDHHQDDPRMHRFVSSANLAVEWVRAGHGPRPGDLVVITHTDCDSVLSSAIVSGRLEPKPEYEAAAIAADHTGAKNGIADLLQSLDSSRDHELSLRNLSLLERGLPLEPAAQQALANRIRKRENAARCSGDRADTTRRPARVWCAGRIDRRRVLSGFVAEGGGDPHGGSASAAAVGHEAAPGSCSAARYDTAAAWDTRVRPCVRRPLERWLEQTRRRD